MLTNDQDKIHYLANVLRVAFADKSLSARETAALEEIRKGIDAKKGLVKKNDRHLPGRVFHFNQLNFHSPPRVQISGFNNLAPDCHRLPDLYAVNF